MTTAKSAAEWRRLSSADSVGEVVAQVVADFRPATVEEALGRACAALTVPTGWLVAASGDTVQQPVRAIVTGHRSRGGWQGCDTLAAFRFTGMPPPDVGTAHASDTLLDLRASSITSGYRDVSPAPAVWAVRSSGYVTAAGRYCQDLWMGEFQAASRVVGGSIGRSVSFPGSSSSNCCWMSNRPPCSSSNWVPLDESCIS